jgi:predicted HTH domain antitoxin
VKDIIKIDGIRSEDVRTELGIKKYINGSDIFGEWMDPAFQNKP